VLSECCEIDVELANPSNEVIERGVELANNVIWEDRNITIQTVTSQQAADLPLRKEPSREGDLRVIEIEGFDLTPCGGTHAFRTGEVGMIAVRHWERAKGLTRIEFVAGMRALADYRRANTTARDVASLFSSARDDAPALAARILDENKDLHRRVRELESLAAEVEAEELIRDLRSEPFAIADGSSPRIVTKVYSNRSPESLKQLAHALIAHENVVALLASNDHETARLVFARSTDTAGDMNALMKEACALLDGRGGGKPDFAQGGGKNVEKIQDALDAAFKQLQ
jgi:alanyl-tRNA synthetase